MVQWLQQQQQWFTGYNNNVWVNGYNNKVWVNGYNNNNNYGSMATTTTMVQWLQQQE